MLDIGFSEIVLIFGLALVVLGPEKLPRVAAQVGRWIGRARGMARQFREQLEEEVNLEEARKTRPPAVTPPPPVAIQPPAAPPSAEQLPAVSPSALPPSAQLLPVVPPPAGLPSAEPLPPVSTSDVLPAPSTLAERVSTPSAVADPATLGLAKQPPAPSVPAAEASTPQSLTEPEQPVVYPDHYSHAHPTDSLGRPIEPPTNEAPGADSGQHDWIGAVTATDKPAQTPTAAAYAPSHERGT